jgi:hypothetical protein
MAGWSRALRGGSAENAAGRRGRNREGAGMGRIASRANPACRSVSLHILTAFEQHWRPFVSVIFVSSPTPFWWRIRGRMPLSATVGAGPFIKSDKSLRIFGRRRLRLPSVATDSRIRRICRTDPAGPWRWPGAWYRCGISGPAALPAPNVRPACVRHLFWCRIEFGRPAARATARRKDARESRLARLVCWSPMPHEHGAPARSARDSSSVDS